MRMIEARFQSLNLNKANFLAIYHQPDPREYFRVLFGLDYVIPELSKAIFRSLIESCGELKGKRPKVVDLGSSYGINAALIRYPIDMQRLAGRYSNPEMHAVSSESLTALDRNYFNAWPELLKAKFVGLDASESAVSYARAVGLIEDGVTSDLERSDPTPAESQILSNIDLVISTGCVGYITERTFRRILSLQDAGQMPWVANFVLRMFSYDSIAQELESFGLVTEKLNGVTFVQRRFHSEEEFEATLKALKAQGLDPAGKEDDGLFHAELFLSRPKAHVQQMPLGELISITSGANRNYGRRYRRVTPRHVKLMP